jgi:hypothetical protein
MVVVMVADTVDASRTKHKTMPRKFLLFIFYLQD